MKFDDDAKASAKDGMDDDELLAILKAEEYDASSYYTSELARDQADAMDRYYGAPYGNEIKGRSSITTHDIEDTINWMLPDLMRVFMSADDLITVVPNSAEDEDNCDPAAQYLQHILFSDNQGATIIHDFAFDGLLQRIGVLSVMWEDPEPLPVAIMENVPAAQLERIMANPEYEILEQEQVEGDEDDEPVQQPSGQPGQPAMGQALVPAGPTPLQPQAMPSFNLKVQKTPKIGRVKIDNVPPEELALSRRARAFPSRQRGTSKSADYCRRKQERYLADVMKEFPDSKAELEMTGSDNVARQDDQDTDQRVLARFQNESISVGQDSANHAKRKKVDFYTEYLWIDFDGDGTVELRRIMRVGDTILENVAVDDCEFKTWSPIRVAHKAIGRSVADTIIDLQRIRTTIMRLLLDSLSQSLVPRTAVNTDMIDEEGIDDLLDADIGGVVRVRGDVRSALSPLVAPDVSAPAMTALEYIDQNAEQRSGVSRHAQGIAPDAITKTAAGIDMLQSAAGERIELVARWLGLALEDVLARCLQLVIAHQDGARWVKINGQPMDIDPTSWSDDMAVKIHVGMGGASRQTQLANLSAIAMKQEQAILQAGPQNPVCSVVHLVHTYSRMTEIMGFKDASKFWNDKQQTEQMVQQASQSPPPPDPKMAEVQMKGQIAQADLQQKAQNNQAELQLKTQAHVQDAQLKADTARASHQMNTEVAAQKAAQELQIALRKIEAEMAIAQKRLEMEMEIARERMIAEMQLEQQAQAHGHMMAERSIDLTHRVAMKKAQINNESLGKGTSLS